MLSGRQGAKANHDVGALIARKQYGKAIEVLEEGLKGNPGSVHLRQTLADVLVRAGEGRRAARLLRGLAEQFAADGFAAKSVAVLKRIQRIDPAAAQVDAKLAGLLQRREGRAPGSPGDRPVGPAAAPVATPRPAPTPPPTSPPALAATSELRVSGEWAEEAARRDDGLGLSPLLAELAPGEVAAMVGGLKLVARGPGAILLTEGEPGDSLFILTTGVARVYRRDATGHNFQVATLREGDFFGEAALLTGQPRTATITAATDCELLVLDRPTFETLAQAYPRVRRLVEEFHAQRRSQRPPG
jgi:cAMP-dependent protein kinase regulator